MSDIKKIKDEFLSKLKDNLNLDQINQIKTDLFGNSRGDKNMGKYFGRVSK